MDEHLPYLGAPWHSSAPNMRGVTWVKISEVTSGEWGIDRKLGQEVAMPLLTADPVTVC